MVMRSSKTSGSMVRGPHWKIWRALKLSAVALGIGLVMAALAAVAGLTDFMGDERIRSSSTALQHMLANVTAVVLELVNFFLRLNNNDSIAKVGIYLSVVVVLILVYSGWKGGELVFRHGVGVIDDHTG